MKHSSMMPFLNPIPRFSTSQLLFTPLHFKHRFLFLVLRISNFVLNSNHNKYVY